MTRHEPGAGVAEQGSPGHRIPVRQSGPAKAASAKRNETHWRLKAERPEKNLCAGRLCKALKPNNYGA